MGMLQDHAYCEFEGQYKIEVEARINGMGGEYALIINNHKQDQITGFLGKFMLRGFIQDSGSERLVIAHVKQHIWGTRFALEIDGKTVPLIKDK